VKHIVILAIAVALGIYIYRRMTGRKPAGTTSTGLFFSASDLDPLTGAQLPPNAQPGTVNFSAQGN
jgi:hypothetical protein